MGSARVELSGGGDAEDEDVPDVRIRVAVVDVLHPKVLRGGLDDLNGDGIGRPGRDSSQSWAR